MFSMSALPFFKRAHVQKLCIPRFYFFDYRHRLRYCTAPNQKPPLGAVFDSFLRLFEKHPLAERGVELCDLDLAFDGLFILAGPDDVIGLRGLEPEQAIL